MKNMAKGTFYLVKLLEGVCIPASQEASDGLEQRQLSWSW